MNKKNFQITVGMVIITASLMRSEVGANSEEQCPSPQALSGWNQQLLVVSGKSRIHHCPDTPVFPSGGEVPVSGNIVNGTGTISGNLDLSTVSSAGWNTHVDWPDPDTFDSPCFRYSWLYFTLQDTKRAANGSISECVYVVCSSSKPCSKKGACNINNCYSPGGGTFIKLK
jgi:hypothetical protein